MTGQLLYRAWASDWSSPQQSRLLPWQLLYRERASDWSSPPQTWLCPGKSSTGHGQVTVHHHSRAGYAQATPLPGADERQVITTAEQAMPGQLLYR